MKMTIKFQQTAKYKLTSIGFSNRHLKHLYTQSDLKSYILNPLSE
jgi:hypothetical protein